MTGLYATFYSFLKYFKAWYAHEDNRAPVAQSERTPEWSSCRGCPSPAI
nr:Uncharacterised protein [Klebsiella pneumoniae]